MKLQPESTPDEERLAEARSRTGALAGTVIGVLLILLAGLAAVIYLGGL